MLSIKKMFSNEMIYFLVLKHKRDSLKNILLVLLTASIKLIVILQYSYLKRSIW